MKQARIAVVDDETVVCRRLSQMLARDGHDVEAFTTAILAWIMPAPSLAARPRT